MNKFILCLAVTFILGQMASAQMSCNSILGKAISLPKPVYPENVNFTHDREIIEVSDEAGFVVNGKAKIGIKLQELNLKRIKELNAFGVEIIDLISSKTVIVGQIPIEKIEVLLELDNIVYVFPFWIKSLPKPVI